MSLDDIYDAVLEYDDDGISDLVKQELDAETPPKVILDEALIEALDEVGRCFSDGTIFVPEMLMAAETMKVGLDILRPLFLGDKSTIIGTAVIGSVKGDMHDIGKNLVAMMLEGASFNVIDLGVDVDTDRFLAAAHEHDAEFIMMSALLTTTMKAMETSVRVIKDERPDLKVIVGGAPVNQSFADAIGANGYSDDAPGAISTARTFV
ncbi:MAG: cobalamin-binding protein [Gammaproteobacteria bacterium]|nr:cobalamin-binding protein [Gammaproteobacteria bacterium]